MIVAHIKGEPEHPWRTLQAMVESLLKEYPGILILRVRMPIVADLLYPRNFITKILKYDKVRLPS